ncbi:MAG: chromosomal replication initiator protein DnaA [Lachnospiraceae bacterium]|nr:chromosomal replication initiator protein DnaA [Lachnospiraceae bacterium]
MEELIEHWPEILEKIKENEEITDVAFRTFVEPFEVVDVRGNKVYIVVPTEQIGLNFFYKRYQEFVTIAIGDVLGIIYEIVFISSDQKNNLNNIEETGSSSQKKFVSKALFEQANLVPYYSFDTFVVGNNNKLAHAASLAVAESPGETYNPLFIYGGVGLGKTHLMHSIGHYVLEQNPQKKVLYVSSEVFTNEVIEAVRSGNASSMSKVRDKYRTVDVLLIDDIQFIIGKDTTQEEFFHTFNALQQQRKAIVLTSDRPPKEMETLEERFRSRFEMGLMVDIQSPDYETRMAILRKKAESEHYKIDDWILQYIAENVKSNIRELEGALNKLHFSVNMEKKDITIEYVKNELQSIVSPDENKVITPELIIDVVCEHFHITYDQIVSKTRSNDIAKPRQIAMYLCKNMTSLSQIAIGALLGGRDHSTVIHGIKTMTEEYNTNENTRNTIDIIRKKINPN